MRTKILGATHIIVGLCSIVLGAIFYSSAVWAQVPSIGGVKCSIGGQQVSCDDGPSGGGGGGGGGHRGPDVLDAIIDNVIGPLFGYSSPAEHARKQQAYALHEQGRELSRRGDRRGALAKYREALALDPSSTVTRLNIANNESVLAYEAGDLPLAITKAREATRYSNDPAYQRWLSDLEKEFAAQASWQQANAHNDRGRKLFDEGKYAEAEAAFREAIRLNPNTFHYNLGLALENQRRFAEAEAAYQRNVELDPKYSNGHFRLGLMRIYLGRYAEAERAYRAAAQLLPSDANTRINLGFALDKQGNRTEAEAQYREAIKLAPGNYWGHYRLGELFSASQRYGEAEAPYREAVRLEPKNAEARFGFAYALRKNGKRDEAEVEYREVIRLNPKAVAARQHLANSLLEHDQAKEAETLLRKAIELDPKYVGAYNSLGVALKNQGRYQEAEAAYRKELELDPTNRFAADNLKNLRHTIESKADSIWSTMFSEAKASAGSVQPFPSGNVGVSPGTSASAAPAERSGGGAAMDQARAASGYGQSAVQSGLSAGTVPSREPASDEARIIFDTPGRGRQGSGGSAVDVSNLSVRRSIPPDLLARNPALRSLQARQEANEAERNRLQDQLDEVRRNKTKPGADRGSLDMREVELKDKLSRNEYDGGLIRREINEKIETARAEAQPEQKPETEYASFCVGPCESGENPASHQQPAGAPAERKP